MVAQASVDGVNSCRLDYVNSGNGKFFLKIHARRQKLDLFYGRKGANAKLCISDVIADNWSLRGFWGLTARNQATRNPKGQSAYSDISVRQLKFINNSPTYY